MNERRVMLLIYVSTLNSACAADVEASCGRIYRICYS
jgi:hypothetical protein